MKLWKSILHVVLLAALSGCAARPAYFGDGARVSRENGASFWEAPARSAPYLQVRMRRRRRAPAGEATVYAGTLDLHSGAPAVLRSTFTLAEGASTSFRFDFNARPARAPARSAPALRYEPGTLVVFVSCARGTCWAASEPLAISPDGAVAPKARKARTEAPAAPKTADAAASAASEELRKDGECAALDDGLKSAHQRAERSGETEARVEEGRLERKYALEGCASWLGEHGGVGAARRRIRLSQWTSLGGQ